MGSKLLVRLFEAASQQDDKNFIEAYEQIVALLQEAKDDYINLRLQADDDNAVILDWLAKDAIKEHEDWREQLRRLDDDATDDDKGRHIINMAKDTFAQLDKDLDAALQADADALEVADDADDDDDAVWHSFTLLHDDAYEAQQKAGEGDDDE